jgi:hypothetical protein
MAMPFTFKSISRQKKKNYGNSNTYFTMQKYTQSSTKKSSQKKGTKILQDIRTLDNSSLKFQHNPKHHLSKILR